MSKYPTIVIKKDRERALTNRHPWLFSGAIAKLESTINIGDIVQIQTQGGNLLGYGHYQGEGHSIAARLFHFTSKTTVVDDAFWVSRFENAHLLRRALYLPTGACNGYRLIFSEGDFLPGLVVDIFDDTASLQITAAGVDSLKPLLLDFLAQKLGIKHIYDGQWLLGHRPQVEFMENGLKIQAHIEKGQKTGYFFDQRDNRRLVGHYAKGRTVLDAFSYSGGFSCNALAGGAKHVTSVDISPEAAEICRANVHTNFGSDAPHNAVAADCFDYLRQLKEGEHDLIVLDPPAFSKSAHTVDKAARGYKDINMIALQKIATGGLLFTFSCSQHISADLFRKIIFGAAKDAHRSVRVLHQMTQAPDHPFDICHPEGEYLKGLALQVI